MREIKFRGKRIDNGDWIYGDLLHYNEQSLIVTHSDENIEDNYDENVIPKTIGQFTGLKDKNGREIYEGDLDQDFDAITWCDNRNGWATKAFDLVTSEIIECHCCECSGNFELSDCINTIEIIGNIHEPTK